MTTGIQTDILLVSEKMLNHRRRKLITAFFLLIGIFVGCIFGSLWNGCLIVFSLLPMGFCPIVLLSYFDSTFHKIDSVNIEFFQDKYPGFFTNYIKPVYSQQGFITWGQVKSAWRAFENARNDASRHQWDRAILQS